MVNEIIFGIIDFIKLLIPLVIISFISLKLGMPLRKKIADRYDLSWVKSALVINFSLVFGLIILIYFSFIFIGFSAAAPQEASLEYTAFEYVLMFAVALVRILITTIILSLALLFFEFLSSIIISTQNKEKSDFIKEVISVVLTSAIFLFLFLFFFSWVVVGLFVFIFYGSATSLPLLSLIISL